MATDAQELIGHLRSAAEVIESMICNTVRYSHLNANARAWESELSDLLEQVESYFA